MPTNDRPRPHSLCHRRDCNGRWECVVAVMTNSLEERTRKVVSGALKAVQDTGHEVSAIVVKDGAVEIQTQPREAVEGADDVRW